MERYVPNAHGIHTKGKTDHARFMLTIYIYCMHEDANFAAIVGTNNILVQSVVRYIGKICYAR